MTDPDLLKHQLAKDILAALLLARQLQESDAAERLLEALEALARDDLHDDPLRKAYLEIAGGAFGNRSTKCG